MFKLLLPICKTNLILVHCEVDILIIECEILLYWMSSFWESCTNICVQKLGNIRHVQVLNCVNNASGINNDNKLPIFYNQTKKNKQNCYITEMCDKGKLLSARHCRSVLEPLRVIICSEDLIESQWPSFVERYGSKSPAVGDVNNEEPTTCLVVTGSNVTSSSNFQGQPILRVFYFNNDVPHACYVVTWIYDMDRKTVAVSLEAGFISCRSYELRCYLWGSWQLFFPSHFNDNTTK